MRRRNIVIGRRAAGDGGVFVAPPGVDARYASNSQLIIGMSQQISQLLMLSWLQWSQTVYLGLSRSPYVMITSRETINNIIGYEGLTGPIRPSPSALGGFSSAPSTATINGGGQSVTVNMSRPTVLAVFNRAIS